MSQCGDLYRPKKKSRGAFSYVFCLKEKDHEGDHRGTGKQWKRDGTRVVPPTEPLPR
jgi:hypothetical protein